MTFYEYITEFTRVYRENFSAPVAVREAKCLAVQSRYEFAPMEPGDLLAGRKRVVPVGFSNEPLLGRSVGWFYDEFRTLEALKAENATEEQTEEVLALLSFWKTQETRAQLRNRFPEEVAKALPEDIYWEHSQVAFPLYRVVGAYMDYDKLLRLGLGGMKAEILALREKAEDKSLYDGCLTALGSLSEVCRRYADSTEGKLKQALLWIAEGAPRSFGDWLFIIYVAGIFIFLLCFVFVRFIIILVFVTFIISFIFSFIISCYFGKCKFWCIIYCFNNIFFKILGKSVLGYNILS